MAENTDVNKQIAVVDGEMTKEEAERPEYQPQYQVYQDTRIPVSKAMGKMWRSRFDDGKKFFEKTGVKDRWQEAIDYYHNDQGGRNGKRLRLGEVNTGKASQPMYATENIVFANVSALVPATYAKNPDINVTPVKSSQENSARLYEKLVDVLFAKKTAPGLNIKPKMRRAVVVSTLTNLAYLELSYVKKEDSSEETVAEIEKLSEQLQKAKSVSEIQEIEGKLQALENKVAFMTLSGPRIRVRQPDMVIVDPNCEETDLCDADWVMIGDWVRTDYIRAMYGKKDEEKDEWMSIYKPTHVLTGDTDMQGHDDEINNFTLLDEGAEHTKYGFASKDDFERSCRTLVWYVWDKTTKRVFMFNDKDWSWPIWVWDDPYHLSRFYPIFPLAYYTDPTERVARSEVMYYLDQQDEINQISNERARMRHWAMSKIFVNKNLIKDHNQLTAFLSSSSDDLIFPLDIPEDKKISDFLGAFPAPSTAYEGLFDPKPIFESVNRISSVTPILQNAQFKTNTTNRAIESYESSTQMRLDEKIDAIEDVLADVAKALIEMCIQFMSVDTINDLLGAEFVTKSGGWTEGQDVGSFNREYVLQIVGGSTLKPTSKVKKEQSMQMGQVLGQFAQASPAVVIVMLKMLQRAFQDDVIITPEEWDFIIQTTMQQLQRGNSQGGQPQQPGQEGQQPAQEGQAQQPQGGDQTAAMMEQVEQIINQLPPQAKQFLGQGIARGVPLKQLVMQLTQAAQSQQPQRPQ